ncbi:MAG: hypothetical protein KAU47_06640, partial [Candidatus Aminicenantes bacterium]|nr:hypothetical protein [Candidatus Aminicenantes bacterium]
SFVKGKKCGRKKRCPFIWDCHASLAMTLSKRHFIIRQVHPSFFISHLLFERTIGEKETIMIPNRIDAAPFFMVRTPLLCLFSFLK